MNFAEALAAIDGTTPPPLPQMFARRLRNGRTLVYGAINGFELPEGIDDAVIVIEPITARRVEDKTAEFVGCSWDFILQTGGKPRG
jgi:hypothetical protein